MLKITPPNITPFRDITDQLPRLLRKEFRVMVERDIVSAVQETLINKLQTEPPRRTPNSPAFVWSNNSKANARARRWWFANVKKGNIPTDGNNYIRSGTMIKKWRVFAVVNTNQATVEIQNRAKGVTYVYGTIELGQVPGHRRTGWASLLSETTKAQRTLDTDIRAAADAMIERVNRG